MQESPFLALEEALKQPIAAYENAPKLSEVLDDQVIPGAANAVLFQFSFE